MMPRTGSYGETPTVTRSPGTTLMRKRRILPLNCASTSWPWSHCTRYRPPLWTATTVPCTSIRSSLLNCYPFNQRLCHIRGPVRKLNIICPRTRANPDTFARPLHPANGKGSRCRGSELTNRLFNRPGKVRVIGSFQLHWTPEGAPRAPALRELPLMVKDAVETLEPYGDAGGQ